jgi:DNA polymerase-1
MRTDKPLILVDGSSYLYRAFHAMPPLTNSRGEPTGAVYGVVNMLRRLIADHHPDCMAVVFDAPGKTFRDEMYEEYKAHRPPMPDDLVTQIEPLHAVIRALGLPLLCVDGVEADDVIGTLATRATALGLRTLVATSDKDMAQLVNDHVTLVNTMTNSYIDSQGVVDKFGVRADQIIDYLALVGDSVDNIPGIPGVGPKTAAKWLQQYGTLDEVVAHAQDVKGKVGDNLRAGSGTLGLSRRLATIHCDVKLDFAPNELTIRPPDDSALTELFQRLEFKTWLAEVLERSGKTEADTTSPEATPRDVSYHTILDAAALDRWIERLAQSDAFAFDLETNSLDYVNAEIVGVSFAVAAHEAAYVPLAHDTLDAPPQLDRTTVLERLRPLLENPERRKIGQNAKFDMSVLANYGIAMRGVAYDTMLESYVINSTGSRHDMDTLALKYLGHKTVTFEEIAGKGANQKTFNQIDVPTASHYAAEDADITLRLHQTLWPMLEAEPSLRRLFEEIEMPLVPVLSRMERAGVLVDAQMLAQQSRELAERLVGIEREAYHHAGQPFNLGSPKQLQEILFTKLKIPVLEKTPTGQPSTAESVLEQLAADHPLPRVILEYRSLSKLKSTYTDRLPEQINPRTGRVHTSYHQAVASTGRLSSSDPNLQNIPIRTEEGRRIRQAFVARPGYTLVAADYSQIELRILAHLSGDERLLQAFASGIDVHRATAAEVFAVPPEQVSSDQRRNAKAINFGLIYGMSSFGLARQLGIERGVAQEYIDLYFTRYPRVKAFMDEIRESARKRGYVETVFGRRLYLPEIKSSNAQRRQYAERTAINAPMQGTAADIIKRAMISVDGWLTADRADCLMVMQVHDELVFEVANPALESCVAEIRRRMSGAAELAVPLVVDVGTGRNWDDAH